MIRLVRLLVGVFVASYALEPLAAEGSNDRLCQAIADTPDVAVPPRDREFLERRCHCFDGSCGYRGSEKYRSIVCVEESAAKALATPKLDEPSASEALDEIKRVCDATRSTKKAIAAVTLLLQQREREAQARAALAQRERIEAERAREALQQDYQRNGPSPALLAQGVQEANKPASSREEFVNRCARFLFIEAPSAIPVATGEFVPFCECAWEKVGDGVEVARDACRGLAPKPQETQDLAPGRAPGSGDRPGARGGSDDDGGRTVRAGRAGAGPPLRR